MTRQEALDLAKKYGINFKNQSYFSLSSDQMTYLRDLRRTAGYTYKSLTGKSVDRAFFDSLQQLDK